MKRCLLFTVRCSLITVLCSLFTVHCFAQSGSLVGNSTMTPKQESKPLKMSQASLIYQAAPRQRTYQEEDIVRVYVKYDWVYNNITNNQRKKSIKTSGRITRWFNWSDFLAFPAKAVGSLPEIGGEIDHKTQNQGTMQRRENFSFTVACRVVSVQENGNLIIEGTQSFDFGEESKLMYVGGIIRPEDILVNNTVDGSSVSELTVKEIPDGNVFDTVRRPWGTRLLEHWKPF